MQQKSTSYIIPFILLILLISSYPLRAQTFSGIGSMGTRPFIMTTPWEIQWTSTEEYFSFSLYQEDGEFVDFLTGQEGTYYYPNPGSFSLRINASGQWEINIIELPKESERIHREWTFYGKGRSKTNTFTVNSMWQVNYLSGGEYFQLLLYSEKGHLVEAITSYRGAGQGSFYYSHPGTYSFQVNTTTTGDWGIDVKEINTLELAGYNSKNTIPFYYNGSWEVLWESWGESFQLFLFDGENGDFIRTIAAYREPGKGIYGHGAGLYFLRVNTQGPWILTIQGS